MADRSVLFTDELQSLIGPGDGTAQFGTETTV